MHNSPVSRRRMLSLIAGSAIVMPAVLTAARAHAEQNKAIRDALKYQDSPMKGQQCSGCMQFVPGKTPKDRGGCKVIAGDTEISPQGWCTAWVAAPAK